MVFSALDFQKFQADFQSHDSENLRKQHEKIARKFSFIFNSRFTRVCEWKTSEKRHVHVTPLIGSAFFSSRSWHKWIRCFVFRLLILSLAETRILSCWISDNLLRCCQAFIFLLLTLIVRRSIFDAQLIAQVIVITYLRSMSNDNIHFFSSVFVKLRFKSEISWVSQSKSFCQKKKNFSDNFSFSSRAFIASVHLFHLHS